MLVLVTLRPRERHVALLCYPLFLQALARVGSRLVTLTTRLMPETSAKAKDRNSHQAHDNPPAHPSTQGETPFKPSAAFPASRIQ